MQQKSSPDNEDFSFNYNSIAAEIIEMKNNDLQLRKKLIDAGQLFKGYNEEMEKVHLKNAERLWKIINKIGWPAKSKVGSEANDAAMIIVQHAISLPAFQKDCLQYIKEAVDKGEEAKRNYAFLYDRICFNERRPQRFGTQHDWDENGLMSPWKIDTPEKVNELRIQYGLNPIEEETESIRKGIEETGERPPHDFKKRQKEIEEWSRRTGWIKN